MLKIFYKNIFFVLLKDIPSLFRESIYIYKYYYNIIALSLLLDTTYFMKLLNIMNIISHSLERYFTTIKRKHYIRMHKYKINIKC